MTRLTAAVLASALAGCGGPKDPPAAAQLTPEQERQLEQDRAKARSGERASQAQEKVQD